MAEHYGVTSLSEKRKKNSPEDIKERERKRFEDMENQDVGGTSGDPDQGLDLLSKGASTLNRGAKKKKQGMFSGNRSAREQMEALEEEMK